MCQVGWFTRQNLFNAVRLGLKPPYERGVAMWRQNCGTGRSKATSWNRIALSDRTRELACATQNTTGTVFEEAYAYLLQDLQWLADFVAGLAQVAFWGAHRPELEFSKLRSIKPLDVAGEVMSLDKEVARFALTGLGWVVSWGRR